MHVHTDLQPLGRGCIRRYGTLHDGILTTWRLIRCLPLTKGGFDPVPGG